MRTLEIFAFFIAGTVALFEEEIVQDLQSNIQPNIVFNKNLSCGACVMGGYTFCW